MSQTTEIMNSTEVAQLLGKSIRTISRMAATGELPYIKKDGGPNGRYQFDGRVIREIADRRAAAS